MSFFFPRCNHSSLVVTAMILIATTTMNMPGVVVVHADLQNGICDLDCPTAEGSVCVFGDAPPADGHNSKIAPISNQKTINGMHCSQCPMYTTGIQCEIPYHACGEDEEHVCYYGGICKNGVLDDYGNEQPYCDCSNAIEETTGNPYVGEYCEHPTLPDSKLCTSGPNMSWYCANYGICNDQYPNYGNPCLCKDGFDGPRCEESSTSGVVGTNKNNDVVSQQEEWSPNFGGSSPSSSSSCPLDCQNGGQCQLGQNPNQSDEYRFWDDAENAPPAGMYCQCPNDFDGPYCEVERVECGAHHCFHGATCLSKVNEDNGELLHKCDCTTTTGDVPFAGRFCQYPATDICARNSNNGDLFCVNDGTCQENAFEGCVCPPGYTGFSCEFRLADDTTTTTTQSSENRPLYDPEEVTECNMGCVNGGRCRHGKKQIGGGLDMFAENTQHLNGLSGTKDFQHCVCPDNFAGTYCELQVDSCPSGQHLCMHGGKCVDNGQEQLCDCDQADSKLATFFAGNHCEHPVNEICTRDREQSKSSVTFSSIMPGTPISFCVNGGRCKDFVGPSDPHPGCHCQDGFLGPHCELRESPDIPNLHGKDPYSTREYDRSDKNGSGSGSATFALILSITAIAVVAVFSVHTYSRRRKQRNLAITSSVNWQRGNYRDQEPEDQVNIAPKRGSAVSDEVYEKATEEAFSRSSRDPIAAQLSQTAAAIAKATRSVTVSPDNILDKSVHGDDIDVLKSPPEEPVIFMGPPKDEDGHELHNVSIV